MLRENFNRNWICYDGSASFLEKLQMTGNEAAQITLPHDAMIHQERTPDTKNGAQTGFYPGGNFEYVKKLFAPEEWAEKTVILEFEGVADTAMVYVNDCLAATNLYAYSNFYVELDRYLRYGEENTIKVVADNSAEKNTRWYTGTGIYRNVKLLVGSRIHVSADGMRIRTFDVSEKSAMVEVETRIRNISRKKEPIRILLEIMRDGYTAGKDQTVLTMFGGKEEVIRQKIHLEKPDLWDCDEPNLYECRLTLSAGDEILDTVEDHFGVRRLELDAEEGLRINGKPVKLRGTCVHHDNGIIGAVTLERAEERKCRLLKQAGFNSIRNAHHPASKALLDACDRTGILVMDELFDMWTHNKNQHDFAIHFESCWEDVAEAMVAKDYNHPSVIMYSIGNEIQELGSDRGYEISRMLSNKLHDLDSSRYVTNGVHGMIAVAPRMEELVADLQKTMQSGGNGEKRPESVGREQMESGEGSSGLNSYTDLLVGEVGNAFACHPIMTEMLEELQR